MYILYLLSGYFEPINQNGIGTNDCYCSINIKWWNFLKINKCKKKKKKKTIAKVHTTGVSLSVKIVIS